MPSTTSSSVSRDLASSTVMAPSLPTFFMASAMNLPISGSPLNEIVPTWAISSFEVTVFECLFRSSTTALTGGNRLGPLLDDCMGEHGCRCGAVAGLVRGLACDLAHHLGAHVLELSSSSIALATVTPSLLM